VILFRRLGGAPVPRWRPSISTLALAAGLIAARATAQPFPGFPIQVNDFTTSDQFFPAIASGGDGGFVVVWQSYGQDGSSDGVFVQRYDGYGTRPLGSTDFQVNVFTTGSQRRPAVAYDGAGEFVVAWESANQDGSGNGIFADLLATGGKGGGLSRVFGDFQVNGWTTGDQSAPDVAADGAGNFVIVWTSADEDGSETGVFAQRYNAGGHDGDEFQVNTYTTGYQSNPSAAMDRFGNFVVVWSSLGQDGAGLGVFGQRFDNTGAKVGPEFAVNGYTTGHQTNPRVAIDHAGNFVVVWENGVAIAGQRFDVAGERVGPEFQINPFTGYPGAAYSLAGPQAAFDPNGDLAVAWNEIVFFFSPPGFIYDVQGERFDRSGNVLGGFGFTDKFSTMRGARLVNDGKGIAIACEGDDPSGFGVFQERQSFVAAPMRVDVHPGTATVSDQNGILEPGETVVLEPGWRNVLFTFGAVPAAGHAFLSGPPGGTYALSDVTANYGSVGVGSFNCYDATPDHDCYVATVGGARASVHWDADLGDVLNVSGSDIGDELRKLHIGDSFSDVPRSEQFYAKIETALHAGIAAGCGGTKFCPGDPVSRSQMAIFIARGVAGGGGYVPTKGKISGVSYDCSPGGNSLYSDVSPTDSFCKHVHYIGAQGVTLGCGSGKYCPNEVVTRDAMAAFIAKALLAPLGGAAVPTNYTDPGTGRSYSCNSTVPSLHFTDVPATNPFCKHIHYLWARNIVAGCSATEYCPGQSVLRDAMAKFLANGFGLTLY
jgi:hypothetical protein